MIVLGIKSSFASIRKHVVVLYDNIVPVTGGYAVLVGTYLYYRTIKRGYYWRLIRSRNI